jgi:poly-gamma-glutamate synthesis protein (capsule biosynthesis protein)
MMSDAPDNCVVAVGDLMLGDSAICVGYGFHSSYPRDAAPAFTAVADRLRRGEVVIGNLECLLTERGLGATRLQADQMRGDPTYAHSLRAAGFNVISVANNHAMQHGIAAFDETVEHLKAAGISCVGLKGEREWCSKPVIVVTRQGLRVGILGYCWRPRQYELGTPPYAEGDADAVARDVQRLRGDADVVVVSLHWGEEFLDQPSAGEVAAARRIIDAGASLIIGHHPHVLRPVECYRNGVICYSLGNFVTDMLWQDALRTGGMLEWDIARGISSPPLLSTVKVDRSYRPVIDSTVAVNASHRAIGLPEAVYTTNVALSVRMQQRAAYAYALRNVARYRPEVLATMVGTTVRNKLAGMLSRSRPFAQEAPR